MISVKRSPNLPSRPRIWSIFLSVKWSRPPRSGSRSRAWTLCKMILFHAHFWTSKFLLKSQQNLVELWVRRTMWSHVSAFLPLEVYSFFQANNLAKAQETIIAKGKLSETPAFLKVARARKVVDRSLLSSKGPEAPVLHEGRARARARARALSTRDILGTSRKHRLSNKSATASSPRIRPYSV